jgi:hypothetical protein
MKEGDSGPHCRVFSLLRKTLGDKLNSPCLQERLEFVTLAIRRAGHTFFGVARCCLLLSRELIPPNSTPRPHPFSKVNLYGPISQ